MSHSCKWQGAVQTAARSRTLTVAEPRGGLGTGCGPGAAQDGLSGMVEGPRALAPNWWSVLIQAEADNSMSACGKG